MRTSKTTTPARSVALINKALAERFPGIQLAKNRGAASFHIYSEDPALGTKLAKLPETTIYANSAGQMTVDQWVKEVGALLATAETPVFSSAHKHTPGPWRIREVKDAEISHEIGTINGYRVCDVLKTTTSDSVSSANAILIALSPELGDIASMLWDVYNAGTTLSPENYTRAQNVLRKTNFIQ